MNRNLFTFKDWIISIKKNQKNFEVFLWWGIGTHFVPSHAWTRTFKHVAMII